MSKRFLFLAVLALVLVSCTGGNRELSATPTQIVSPTPTLAPLTLSIPADVAKLSNVDFASFYKLDAPAVTPNAPQYTLPLDLSTVQNLADVEAALNLTPEQEAMLSQNGFVVVPGSGEDDILKSYGEMQAAGIPNFVTADTMLHLYHVIFASVLKSIEENELVGTLNELTKAMFDRAVDDYARATNGAVKEAARRNVAYFGVALTLLQTETPGPDETDRMYGTPVPPKKYEVTMPDYVADEVATEVERIDKKEGFARSAIFDSSGGTACPAACGYCEDYSQYQPRGYYNSNDTLRRYFRAMMWYGRMAFFLKGGSDAACASNESDALTTATDAKTATIQAALIAAEMPGVKAGKTTVADEWTRIYDITSFFVGAADDLTPYQYLNAVRDVFGPSFDGSALADDTRLLDLKAELASLPSPKINGGTGECQVSPPFNATSLDTCLDAAKGMRFIGQRFVPDAAIQQGLIFPTVGSYTGSGGAFTAGGLPPSMIRAFARGLDVMAALGSQEAYDILSAEGDTAYGSGDQSYDAALAKAKEPFTSLDVAGWTKNLYWSWLYMLPSLLQQPVEGEPTFMQTPAWQDRELQSALASWTELRHDTILYAKQVMLPGGLGGGDSPPPLEGYAEPSVELYARMLANLGMVQQGLAALNVQPQGLWGNELDSLSRCLTTLIEISRKELAGEELTEAEYYFVTFFKLGVYFDEDVKKTTLVADVQGTQEQVLEEGTGYVDLMVVAYKLPDGRVLAGVGPAMSYYEFKEPLSSRLTDEQWRDMLANGQTPSRPDWVSSFYAGSGGESTVAPTTLTAASTASYKVYRDPSLGVEFEYPASWIEGAPTMPYNFCPECRTVGPARAEHPYGVEVFEEDVSPGCSVTCYVGNRALPLQEDDVGLTTVAGHAASRVEVERTAPLGPVDGKVETVSYREIWTYVPVGGRAVFLIGFWRSDEPAAEAEVRSAYRQVLDSLTIIT